MAEPPLRLAVFGGVYSNHLALDAVLADIARHGADEIWCLGDVGGFGPTPERSIERLRAANVPVIQGNYDHSIGHALEDCACGYTDPRDQEFAQRSYDYTLARTGPEQREWLRDLPVEHRFEIGGRRVLLCHGSPRRVNEFLWESTSSDAFLDWLGATHGADVVVCTHTGLPWTRVLPSGRVFVNVGAIGRPANDGRSEVGYAMMELGSEVRVAERRVGYDHETLMREMESERLPAEFIETIGTGWWTTCLENLPAKERRRGRH